MIHYRLGLLTVWADADATDPGIGDIRLWDVVRYLSFACGRCWGRAFAVAAGHTLYTPAIDALSQIPGGVCPASISDRRQDHRPNCYHHIGVSDFDQAIAAGDLFGVVVFRRYRASFTQDEYLRPRLLPRCFYGIKGYIDVDDENNPRVNDDENNPRVDRLHQIQPDAVVEYDTELAPLLEIARLSSI